MHTASSAVEERGERREERGERREERETQDRTLSPASSWLRGFV